MDSVSEEKFLMRDSLSPAHKEDFSPKGLIPNNKSFHKRHQTVNEAQNLVHGASLESLEQKDNKAPPNSEIKKEQLINLSKCHGRQNGSDEIPNSN
mmetsp:Transcript_18772/g.28880  ORF Transcript_18772/g.28880 Transcript_18772/m.28880 type:complete len:96 (+) Transcript_18772:460-747(+)